MPWYGKLLGALLGALLLRGSPSLGVLLGLLVGHAVDAGWFKARRDDPYRALGLTAQASNAEIELAYRRLMSQYHPDKLARAEPERRRQAERRASEINAAYDRIQRLRRR
ncbi:MAG: DnaJ domain-containing protein [Pseudomonas sp.]